MKHSFAAVNRFGETLKVTDAASFDEAIDRVEKGLYERDLTIGRRLVESGQISAIPADIKFLLIKEGKIKIETVPAPVAAPEPAPAPPSTAPAPEAISAHEQAQAPSQPVSGGQIGKA